jgi:hypothetical protein
MIDFRNFYSINKRWIVAAIIVIIIFSVLTFFVVNIEKEDKDLLVDEVIIGSVEMEGLESDLKISVHMTNKGKSEVDDVKIRAFVIERDSNLARDEASLDMKGIPGKTTKEGELFISVPNNDSYRIELLVFEDSKLTLRGSGTIDLTGVGVASEYRSEDDPNSGGGALDYSPRLFEDGEEDSTAFFAVCLLSLPILVFVIIIYVVVKNQKKRDPESDPEGSLGEDTEKESESTESGKRATPLRRIRHERQEEEEDRIEEDFRRGPFE